MGKSSIETRRPYSERSLNPEQQLFYATYVQVLQKIEAEQTLASIEADLQEVGLFISYFKSLFKDRSSTLLIYSENCPVVLFEIPLPVEYHTQVLDRDREHLIQALVEDWRNGDDLEQIVDVPDQLEPEPA